ncbi:MAG: ribonuclease D, partial [Candidatus Eremiobacteraeota bacterium]|nr:ribonuclease D [Candidatus Eremiobacteraeota bacterium]
RSSVTVVEDPADLEALCRRIADVERVALDTEFHNEKSYAARLMVVQLVLGDEVAIVDPLRVRDLEPLAAALATKTVVGHALQSDLKIFADRFGRVPGAAFDTQLAAAFCGYGMSISLADLVADVVGIRLRKSQTVSDWSTRPLSAQQIDYLVDDVRHLFALQDALVERLTRGGRLAWFEDEARPLVDPAKYRPDPERLYLRVPGAMRMSRRELGILRAVAQTRDALARERDVPLKYIIPDDVMGGIVSLRPQTRDDLAQLRRLDAGARKAYGDRIVAAVAAGLALDDEELPKKPARPPGADREAIVSCLAVLAGAIAAEHELPTGLLVTRSALERVARELPATPDAVAKALEASPWRASLVAAPLHALISGQVALTIAGAARGSPRVARVATGGDRAE